MRPVAALGPAAVGAEAGDAQIRSGARGNVGLLSITLSRDTNPNWTKESFGH